MARRWVLGVLAPLVAFVWPAPVGGQSAMAAEPTREWVQTGDDSVVDAETMEVILANPVAEAVDASVAGGHYQAVEVGDGFSVFGLRNYGDYTIRLVTSGEGTIENYRGELDQMAAQVNAKNGTSIRVAAGTVPGPADPLDLVSAVGEIWVMISTASGCGDLSGGALGCAGPDGASVIEGEFRYDGGVVWLSPTLDASCDQVVVNHEVGHALGLAHFNADYQGVAQVMKSSTACTFPVSYQAGDLNGIGWLVEPQPANDSVANAEVVCPLDASVSAVTWFATKEAAEPAHAGQGPRRSVWYQYLPLAGQDGGTATIFTTGGSTGFDTVLAVYRGAMFSNVIPVASNDDFSGTLSQVSFTVDATQSYWIAVDGFDFERGRTGVIFDFPVPVDSFVPLCTPFRPLDTRPSGIPLAANTTYELQVAGLAGVPADADSVALNVTSVLPSAPGFVTVFPCGQAVPNASNLNFAAGDVIPNSVLARIGTAGKVCLFSSATTHLLVDVSGYFPATDAFVPLGVPGRVLDTRSPGGQTVDGLHQAVGQMAANTTYELPVPGRAGVPGGVASVVLNVTAVLPVAPGFLTVFPCGQAVPNASNLNFAAGDVIPNQVLVRVGTGDKVCLYTSATTDLLVDVSGYFMDTVSLVPLTAPARVLDTRAPSGQTIDGLHQAVGRVSANSTYELPVAARGGVPGDAGSVVLNVTAVLPSAAGFVTVFPCGQVVPTASNLNYAVGEVIPNSVVARVGTGGKVCLFSSAATDLLVDVSGYFD